MYGQININNYPRIQVFGGVTLDVVFTPVLIDLTQMFGSSIADYVYSLGHDGAAAWFRHLFPKPYYSYNAGQLMSVNTSAHITRGFNLLQECNYRSDTYPPFNQRKAIRVISGVRYQFTCEGFTGATSWRIAACCYDLDGNKIYTRNELINISGEFGDNNSGRYYVSSNNGQHKKIWFTANFNGYMYFWFTLGDTTASSTIIDPCFHIVWDGERDGEYEHYEEHVYPLDESLTLRGIPKLDSGNNLYYDGDTYESDGKVTRKYGIVDLGTLTWLYYSSSESFMYTTSVSNLSSGTTKYICSKYANYGSGAKCMSINGTILRVYDSDYTDPATFKTAMSGVYLVYELATPTTESADPYQNPQIVNDFGTEEYTDYGVVQNTREVAVPVGHVTLYVANLRAKLEMAPESPDGDGDYVVRQTNGINEYIPLVIPQELPDFPTDNGTYRLQVVVSGSTKTLSWVSVS